MRKSSGFTLIELLVVIAIIGILAAVLIPAVKLGIVRAKKSESLMELHQIGGAFHIYLAEHAYNFPPGWGGGQGTYGQYINPYIYGKDNRTKDNMFAGPFAQPITILSNGSGHVYSFPITYSVNPLICRIISQFPPPPGSLTSLDQIPRPSGTILLVDGCQNPSNNNQANATIYAADNFGLWGAPPSDLSELIAVGPDTDEATSNGNIRYPHGTACALFVDGSAHKIKKGQMTAEHIYPK